MLVWRLTRSNCFSWRRYKRYRFFSFLASKVWFVQTFKILVWGLFHVELMIQPKMTPSQDLFLCTQKFGVAKLRNFGKATTLLTMADSLSPASPQIDSPSTLAVPADSPESVDLWNNPNTRSVAHFHEQQHSRKVLYVLALGLTTEDSLPLIRIDNEPWSAVKSSIKPNAKLLKEEIKRR